MDLMFYADPVGRVFWVALMIPSGRGCGLYFFVNVSIVAGIRIL